MQKNVKSHYLTVLRTANQNEGDLTNSIYSESDDVGLYGFIGFVPKYSKPFSQEYLKKIQNDYNNWIDSCNEQEYREMMKEAESKDKKLISNSSTDPLQNPNTFNNFDPVKARHILSKSYKFKDTNGNKDQNIKNVSVIETRNSLDYEQIVKLHHNKQFHVGSVERRDDGTIKTFDQAVTNWRETQEDKLSKKILRYDELDLQQKKKKARLLHTEMTNFLNAKRNEKLQLGLACHQEWALMKVSAPPLNNRCEIQRPITASSKEAMEELEQFEQKQKLLRKEKKAEQNKKESFIQNPESNFSNSNNTNCRKEDEVKNSSDQSFKLTQLPPGSAIVG